MLDLESDPLERFSCWRSVAAMGELGLPRCWTTSDWEQSGINKALENIFLIGVLFVASFIASRTRD